MDLTAWRAWIRPLYENRITRDRHSWPFIETAHNKGLEKKKEFPVISLIKLLFSFPKLTIEFSHSSSTSVMGFLFFVMCHPHTGFCPEVNNES